VQRTSATSIRLVWALRVWGVTLIALHLLTPRLPEATAWGLWPATYLPLAWRWGLALLALAAIFFGPRLRLPIALSRPWLTRPRVRALVALGAGLAFYALRLRHLRWGDAYILANAIPHPDVRLTYVWQAPLDVFLHARLWQAANRLFGWPDPVPVYWIVSAAAGAVFVWLLLGLAAWLGRTATERALIIGLIGTLGTMQLFFGYVENYSLMTVGMLAFLWLAVRAVRGEGSLIAPATVLALTHAFHPSTLVLAPALLFLAWQRRRLGLEPRLSRTLTALIVPYAVVGAGVLALMTAGGHGVEAFLGADFPGGGDRRWLVPLVQTTTPWEHYTMFSAGHLLDIINQQWLSAPMIWVDLLLCALLAWSRLPRRDPTFRLLGVAALSYLLLTLVWNPDYGGQRDWDLFAPAAVPAALWLAYTLPHVLPEPAALTTAAWAVLPPQCYHLAAWVHQNTLPWEWE
jgi:hypothetical protein